ncbi:glutamate 5-kinase [Trichomonascus vanleenenianus]|uniref:glutamate 5-kinase n=1 Tax=Trichomonascus vanleenenianus TaxID=2268995 RepID=UPI003ECBA0DF
MVHKEQKKYTIVIKLGTSSLCDEKTREPKLANMSLIVETIVKLKREGHNVIVVSSGGIAVGLRRLRKNSRPKKLAGVQAVSAIGQARLIGLWDDLFRQLDQPVAQILLTKNDIADRTQYLNAANTLHELISMGTIPIVNENDTLSVSEIRFGDNDTLSAITAGMVNADFLFLMTDVDCLYTDNPRSNPDAQPVLVVNDVTRLKVDVSSGAGSSVGTGGMTTKLIAAELATSAGVTTVICKSSVPGNIHAIVNHSIRLEEAGRSASEERPVGEVLQELRAHEVPLHTRFVAKARPIKDRQFWILHGLSSHGAIYVDRGAYAAITRSNKAGLLPVGVIGVEGTFHESECVDVYAADRTEDGNVNPDGEAPLKIGRALVNYSSNEIERIRGLQSEDIEGRLGYADSEYIAYRDNMAFIVGKRVCDRADGEKGALQGSLNDIPLEA